MARRPREAPPAPGLLASAFSFVSREIESFVTAATGGEVQKTQDQPEASSSRVTLDGKRRKREEERQGRGDRERERDWERERERRAKRVRVESDRARARRKLREDVEGERATKVAKKKSVQNLREERERSSEREAADDEDDELPLLSIPKSLKKRREVSAQQRDEDQDVQELEPQPRGKKPQKGTADPSQLMPPPPNPMPPPPSPLTTRGTTPFPTMPGSLFARSESLIPEPIPAKFQRAVPRTRTPPPPPTPLAILPESTEDAEQQPEEAAEEGSVMESPRRGRSQARQREKSADGSRDRPRPSPVPKSSGHAESSSRAASNPRTSLDEPSEPPTRPRSSKGKERAYDTSGEVRVRGKERELREAREDHARNAHDRDDNERERDKQRIRMLEEEVARLRAELASKSNGASMMPPPPPPPPPPLFRPPIASTTSGGGTNFLASARASLKPTAPPVEAPINSVGSRTRKTGQPTLNLSSDKMAAFLREMKSVRLRKVGGAAGSMGPPSAAGDVAGEALARSTSGHGMSEARRAAIMGDMSFDTGVAARIFIGEKRKRDALEEVTAGPSKRRETTFVRTNSTGGSFASSSQSTSSAASSQSSAGSSSQSSASSASFFDAPSSQSQPSTSKAKAPLRIWPSRSTETDLTTPSLCSDNENDHSEDRLPDTPSDSSRGHNDLVKSVEPRERQPQHEPEIIDVDALETPPRRERSESPLAAVKMEVQTSKDAFARRPPESPMPSKSPVKPRPPARTRSKIPAPAPSKLPLPRRVHAAAPPEERGSDSDDPLDLVGQQDSRPPSRSRRYSVEAHDKAPPIAGPSRIPREPSAASARSDSRSRSQSHTNAEAQPAQPRMSRHARRRLTLDEEVRRAGESLWRESSEEPERPPSPPQEDLDSGQLVALGTKSSRRGFLARGGGAGPPVFMGEGYVQGATAEDEAERGRGEVRRSRSGSTAGVVTRVSRRR
ncbi:hypothetical protein C8T65DRAFT_644282 [Cerioporus squamosus]|nr:hypothetical protein C8T65DRAFT_644282 [Cerioporus squamosus]